MKRIAFVNQRYGKEVNGGSEYYTMLMAQKLKEYYDVEVLTSKALTYDRWEDYYEVDVEELDGVTVRRFGVKRKRNRIIQRILKILITRFGMDTEKMTRRWIKVLGPYIPGLVDYIKEHKDEYDAFIFVTYMYYPTVFGLPEVADKAIFVPTAHDEYCIYFKVYEKLFRIPSRIVYLTEEEKHFVERRFRNKDINNDVIGIGIELPPNINEKRFREKYRIEGEYILYAGRVDTEKGCDRMFAYFREYAIYNRKIELVVIGKAYMEIPSQDNIHYLGFVSDEDKYDAFKGAKLLWLPSCFESLSISVLEAMTLGKPVIVNGKCEVLKGHCEKSKAGMSYTNYNEFAKAVEFLCGDSYEEFCKNAQKYIDTFYVWEYVLSKWKEQIDG